MSVTGGMTSGRLGSRGGSGEGNTGSCGVGGRGCSGNGCSGGSVVGGNAGGAWSGGSAGRWGWDGGVGSVMRSHVDLCSSREDGR